MTGNLVLAGSADFAFASTNAWICLHLESGGTSWVEAFRSVPIDEKAERLLILPQTTRDQLRVIRLTVTTRRHSPPAYLASPGYRRTYPTYSLDAPALIS